MGLFGGCYLSTDTYKRAPEPAELALGSCVLDGYLAGPRHAPDFWVYEIPGKHWVALGLPDAAGAVYYPGHVYLRDVSGAAPKANLMSHELGHMAAHIGGDIDAYHTKTFLWKEVVPACAAMFPEIHW